MAFEEILSDDKVYVPPVSADASTIGDVDEAAKKIEYNQTVLERDVVKTSGAPAGDSSEGSLLMDLGLEAVGLKAIGTAMEFIDERMGDKSAASGKLSGDELVARTNIVSDSIRMESPTRLDGKDRFTQTGKWDGTDTKVPGMQQTKNLVMQNAMKNSLLHDNVMNVRREHQATLSRANQMAPSMGLGGGPSINPSKFLREVEESDDWKKRSISDA